MEMILNFADIKTEAQLVHLTNQKEWTKMQIDWDNDSLYLRRDNYTNARVQLMADQNETMDGRSVLLSTWKADECESFEVFSRVQNVSMYYQCQAKHHLTNKYVQVCLYSCPLSTQWLVSWDMYRSPNSVGAILTIAISQNDW